MFRRRRPPSEPNLVELLQEGMSLSAAFERTGERSTLDQAIAAFEAAHSVGLPSSPLTEAAANELAFALDRRGRVFGSVGDVDRAIELLETELREVHQYSSDTTTLQANLGLFLLHRYETFEDPPDLERSLELLDDALAAIGSDSVRLPLALNSLAKGLHLRFYRTSAIEDLDRSIALQQRALHVLPEKHRQRPGYLNNLGNQLRTRAKVKDDVEDLDEAIRVLQDAADAVPPTASDHAGFVASLAGALDERASYDGNEADSGRAAQLFLDLLKEVPPGTQLYEIAVASVAEIFVKRYPETHDIDLLDDAIALTKYLVDLHPDGSLDPVVFSTYADAHRLRYAATASSDDLVVSRQAYRRACAASFAQSPMNTLRDGMTWGQWAADRKSWSEAAEAFDWSLRASQTLFSRQALRRHKEDWLAAAVGVAPEAAYALAEAGRTADATVAAEQGRALLLSDSLQLSEREVDALRPGHADLYVRYGEAAARIASLELATPPRLLPEST